MICAVMSCSLMGVQTPVPARTILFQLRWKMGFGSSWLVMNVHGMHSKKVSANANTVNKKKQ